MVSLSDGPVESFDHVPGVQANFTVDEFVECDQVLRAHPDVIAALARRGITDLDNVFMDTWTYGDAVAPPEFRGPAARAGRTPGARTVPGPTRTRTSSAACTA